MKKLAIVLTVVLSFMFSAYAEKGPSEIIISKQSNIDYSVFANMKPVYVLVSFNGTEFWGTTFDKWIEKEEAKGKVGLRDELIAKFFKKFDKDLKKGKKWGIKRITDKSEAKDGYLFLINVKSITPIPGLGTRCVVSVDVTEVSTGAEKLSGYMECFQTSSTGIPAPKLSFAESGARVLEKMIIFLKSCK